jgi:hypothetical protein
VRKLLVATALGLTFTATAAGSASAPPAALTAYGRITWNLDALVHDFYGGARRCLSQQAWNIHRCSAPRFDDGSYQVTFRAARHSGFRAILRANPLSGVNAVGVRIGGRYIARGAGNWLAITNAPAGWGEPLQRRALIGPGT